MFISLLSVFLFSASAMTLFPTVYNWTEKSLKAPHLLCSFPYILFLNIFFTLTFICPPSSVKCSKEFNIQYFRLSVVVVLNASSESEFELVKTLSFVRPDFSLSYFLDNSTSILFYNFILRIRFSPASGMSLDRVAVNEIQVSLFLPHSCQWD